MRLYVVPESRKRDFASTPGIYVLTEKDFNPMEPFFKTHSWLEPETIDEIYSFGVFETFEYARYLIKQLDFLLTVNGTIVFDYYNAGLDTAFYIYPLNRIYCEIALVFKDRIVLESRENINNTVRCKYKKTAKALQTGDTMDRWSFGIVSDGRKNERIMQIIERIASFNIKEYEVLVCGPSPSENLPAHVRVLDESDLYTDIRFPIPKKKNRIAEQAKYENIVIIHDRIMPSVDWYSKMVEHGNCFDCLVPSIVDEDNPNIHVLDNIHAVIDEDIRNFWPRRNRKYWSSKLYMDGSVIITKKSIIRDIPIPEFLHWGEKEDVVFCRNLYNNGYLISFNYEAIFTTMTYMKKGHNILNKYNNFRIYIGWKRRRLMERIGFEKYLKTVKRDF